MDLLDYCATHNVSEATGNNIFLSVTTEDLDYQYRFQLLNSLIDHKSTYPITIDTAYPYQCNMILSSIIEEVCLKTYPDVLIKPDHLEMVVNTCIRFIDEYSLPINLTDSVYIDGLSHTPVPLLELIDNFTNKKEMYISQGYNHLTNHIKKVSENKKDNVICQQSELINSLRNQLDHMELNQDDTNKRRKKDY